MNIKTIHSNLENRTPDIAEQTFFEAYTELVEKHRNICIVQIEDKNFIIKSIGRKDFKEIMLNQQLNDYLKEETICEICVLYPTEYSFENADAGIATQLYQEILRFSFMKKDQDKDRSNLMNYFRSEMVELDNQINCMIIEAFPSLTLDEVENFDFPTVLKYLSRAEWILQNLRGFEFHQDPFTGKNWDAAETEPRKELRKTEVVHNEQLRKKEETQKEKQVINNQPQSSDKNGFVKGETIEERIKRYQKGDVKKEALTAEKLAELRRNFPEIDWTAEAQVEDFNVNVESEPVALRAITD